MNPKSLLQLWVKALSVPSARYNSVDLPHTELDYGSVSDQAIMTNSINGLVELKSFKMLHYSIIFNILFRI